MFVHILCDDNFVNFGLILAMLEMELDRLKTDVSIIDFSFESNRRWIRTQTHFVLLKARGKYLISLYYGKVEKNYKIHPVAAEWKMSDLHDSSQIGVVDNCYFWFCVKIVVYRLFWILFRIDSLVSCAIYDFLFCDFRLTVPNFEIDRRNE